MRPQWFPVSEVPFDHMWPDDKLWFPMFFKRQKFNGFFKFEGHDKIISQSLRVELENEQIKDE